MQSFTPPVPTLDTWTSLFLLAAGQGIFLALLLFTQRRGSPRAGSWLGALILSFSVLLIFYVGYWTRYGWYVPQLNLVYPSLAFLLGPFLLFYLDQLTDQPIFYRLRWLHWLPALAVVLLSLPLYMHPTAEIQQYIMGRGNLPDPPLWKWGFEWLLSPAFIVVHLLLYGGLVVWYVQRILGRLDRSSASGAMSPARWVRLLAGLFLLYTVAFLLYFALQPTPYFTVEYDYLISLVMTASIYVIGYIGYRYPRIVEGGIHPKRSSQQARYRNSSLPVSASRSIARKLSVLMQEEYAYRHPELRLSDVATRISVSPHHLSEVINTTYGKTFNQYINEYRVREAMKRLADEANRSAYIIDIAYQVGFNNKTTFYQAFKSLAGMSPSEYRKSCAVDPSFHD